MTKLHTDALLNHRFRQEAISTSGNILVRECHGLAREAGWWTDPATGEPIDPHTPYLIPAKLMLIVSEVAEAMEGDRKDLMDDKLPHRKMIAVELADAIIRCADLAGVLGFDDLGDIIVEKLTFNAQRADHKPENRAKEGGKAY